MGLIIDMIIIIMHIGLIVSSRCQFVQPISQQAFRRTVVVVHR